MVLKFADTNILEDIDLRKDFKVSLRLDQSRLLLIELNPGSIVLCLCLLERTLKLAFRQDICVSLLLLQELQGLVSHNLLEELAIAVECKMGQGRRMCFCHFLDDLDCMFVFEPCGVAVDRLQGGLPLTGEGSVCLLRNSEEFVECAVSHRVARLKNCFL